MANQLKAQDSLFLFLETDFHTDKVISTQVIDTYGAQSFCHPWFGHPKLPVVLAEAAKHGWTIASTEIKEHGIWPTNSTVRYVWLKRK